MEIIKFRNTPEKGPIKAVFSIKSLDGIVVKGFKIIKGGSKGFYLGLPYITTDAGKKLYLVDLPKNISDQILRNAKKHLVHSDEIPESKPNNFNQQIDDELSF